MSAEAIKQVTEAIADRLGAALKLAGSDKEARVGPLDDTALAQAGLALFLYRVSANQPLRNAEHRVARARADQPDRVYTSSLPLDLHYLLTVGPRQQAGEPESLRLLGYALQALSNSPTLPGSDVLGDTVRLSLDLAGAEEISRVWSLFPTVNYRTSVLISASPVWIDPPDDDVAGGPVVYQGLTFGHLPRSRA